MISLDINYIMDIFSVYSNCCRICIIDRWFTVHLFIGELHYTVDQDYTFLVC